jgi:hypothetical protein
MFYYICHLYVAHALAVVIGMAFGQPWRWIINGGFFTSAPPPGWGFNLPMIYFTWLLALVILYFPCRWYMRYKATHKSWWLSYL